MWADCVFEDWADCVWQNTTDNEWDKFATQDRTSGLRTTRLLAPEAIGDYKKRPYLEGNPGYVQDMQRHSDGAKADAIMQAYGAEVRHMAFKQPYRAQDMAHMKYKDESRLPYNDTLSAIMAAEMPIPYVPDLSMPEFDTTLPPIKAVSPTQIIDEAAIDPEIEYEWRWLTYSNDYYWDENHANTDMKWFDDRWLAIGTGGTAILVIDGKRQWWHNFRPTKFRLQIENHTHIHLYLYDQNIQVIYSNADYLEGTDAIIDWKGSDIGFIYTYWIGEGYTAEGIGDIEFYGLIEKGAYLASDQRRPRKPISLISGRAPFPQPVKVRASVRLPRRTKLRGMRGT